MHEAIRVRTRVRARLLLSVLIAFGLLALGPAPPARAAVPAGFRDFTVLSGLSAPTSVEFASDGRVFIAEKSGIIKLFDSLDDTTPTVFADLRTNVYNSSDRGLLGLALHPQFPTNPGVYVLYTYDGDIGGPAPKYGTASATNDNCPIAECIVSGRLSRLTASGNVTTGPEQVLVSDWCQQYTSHSIGALGFGPDGALYASAGDGASFNTVDYGQLGNPANPCGDPPTPAGTAATSPTAEGGALRSQDLRTGGDPVGLDGTVIRIDPATGAGVAGNPLAASSDPNARRIIASGLRNPFRFTFRPGTEELYIGEVGWNSHEAVERIADVNDATAENFGWPCYEGPNRQSGYDGANVNLCENLYASPGAQTQPFFAWAHSSEVVPGDACGTGSSSASGIAFYAGGGGYPASYDGALFFSDYSRDCIWSIPRGAGGALDPAARQRFVLDASGPVDLTAGPGGELYYLGINTGTLHRIGYSAGNQTPFAELSATPTSGNPPLTVAFSAAASNDPDPGDPLTYAWDLDSDGQYDDSTAVSPSSTYTTAGARTVRLRVTDGFGASDEAATTITVGNTAPVPVITSPSDGASAQVGQAVTFAGSASDPQEGPLPASALNWSANLYHCSAPDVCHRHPTFYSVNAAAGGSFTMPDHERIAYVELTLTVTSGGEMRSTTHRVNQRTTDLTFASSPSGVALTVGGSAASGTPFTLAQPTNGQVSVSAPTTALIGGVSHEFVSWSDGGGRSHELIVPAAARTYTATYRPVAGQSLFTDLFEDGNSDGWTVTAGWSVCRPPGNSLEYCVAGATDSWSFAGSTAWGDYAVESAVRMPTEAGGAMVLGRVRDATHWYQFQLKKDGNGQKRWWIQKRNGSAWTTIASGPYDYVANRYYHLRLTMVGSTLTGAISTSTNGTFTTVGSGTDTSYATGRIGLRSWGTATTFDVVKVTGR